ARAADSRSAATITRVHAVMPGGSARHEARLRISSRVGAGGYGRGMAPAEPEGAPSLRSPLDAAGQLAVSLDALAAVAAHLRVEAEGIDLDPALRELLASVASDVFGASTPVGPAERQAIIGMVRAFIYQAEDLVAHPSRAGGWQDANETLLQGL